MSIDTPAQPRTGGERMLALEEARALIMALVDPLEAEQVPLEDCLDRVLTADVVSRLTLPPWPNSAMDGFAVRSTDIAGASAERPVRLRVIGEVAAGHESTIEVGPRSAARILTGAPLPAGADAVVPVEQTDARAGAAELPEMVAVDAPAAAGAHIRPTGSDMRAGDRLLSAGSRATAAAIAVAAAGGHAELPVRRRPRVAVLATGDELVAPGVTPGPAQIPDSNSVGLLAQAREAGAEARSLGIARDDVEEVAERLSAALESADIVVVSGGVSVGAHDVVKDAFSRLGEMALWRVAVQPGKPLAVAQAASAAGRRVLLVGVPGNPVSSFVTFELFVRPAVRRLAGHADAPGRPIVRARLAEPVRKAVGRRAFLRVVLTEAAAGWQAALAGGQGSHVLSALAAADGLAVVPEGVNGLPAGAEVEVIRLPSTRGDR